MICHNTELAERDRTVREQILERLRQEIHAAGALAPSKRSELYGALATKPAYKRFQRKTKTGKLRIDRAAVAREAKLDGKFLLRTSDESLSPADLAEGYKALYEAERGWARPQAHNRHAPRLPPPRGPHRSPRAALLARATTAPRRRDRSR